MDLDDAGMFMKVNIAAQRARQLMQGAVPKVQTESRKPAVIAVQELNAGAIEAFIPEELPELLEEEVLEDDVEEEDL